MKQGINLSEEEFEELLELAQAGPLLPDFSYQWLDDFKSAYAHQLTDMLINYSQQLNLEDDYQRLMTISDVVFSLDPMSEDALSLKCTLLKNHGKSALAKNVYNGFIRDYKLLMGVNFNRSFEDINYK